jgi:hypothetical protein
VPNTLPQAAPTATATPTAAGEGYGGAGPAPAQAAAPPPPAKDKQEAEKKGGGGGGAFDNAMAAYNAGRYDEAGKLFDALAANDAYAALWAARAWRDGSLKCRGTVGRFDSVAGRAAGTSVGYDALLEGARCYRLLGAYDAARDRLNRLLGAYDAARDRLNRLLSVPSHEARAREELQRIAPSNNAANAAPKPAAQTASPPAGYKQDNSY